MKKTVLTGSLFFALPLVAFAQVGTLAPIYQLLNAIAGLIAIIIPLLIAIALVVFFVGLIQYVYNAKHDEGKKKMIAGIVSLFVMVSIWGIIRLAQDTFLGGTSPTQVNAPRIPLQ